MARQPGGCCGVGALMVGWSGRVWRSVQAGSQVHQPAGSATQCFARATGESPDSTATEGASDQPRALVRDGRFHAFWNTREHPLGVWSLP